MDKLRPGTGALRLRLFPPKTEEFAMSELFLFDRCVAINKDF